VRGVGIGEEVEDFTGAGCLLLALPTEALAKVGCLLLVIFSTEIFKDWWVENYFYANLEFMFNNTEHK